MTDWEAVKKKGFLRFILVNGILLFGLPVTIVTAIVRFYVGATGADSWQSYLMSNGTWIGFILQALVSGVLFGAVIWVVGDRAAKKKGQLHEIDEDK